VLIGRWVTLYNEERLHASLQCLPPAEFHRGHPDERTAERSMKLERARRNREQINRHRYGKAA
jgi:hypothetical protein